MIRQTPSSTLFPYATLFRSDCRAPRRRATAVRRAPRRAPSPPPRSRGPSDRRRAPGGLPPDRKSTRLNSSHANISYAVFCLKKKFLFSIVVFVEILLFFTI